MERWMDRWKDRQVQTHHIHTVSAVMMILPPHLNTLPCQSVASSAFSAWTEGGISCRSQKLAWFFWIKIILVNIKIAGKSLTHPHIDGDVFAPIDG